MNMRRRVSLGSMLIALAGVGCVEPGRKFPWGWPFYTSADKNTPTRGASPPSLDHPFTDFRPPDPDQPGVEFLTIDFQILRVELPWAPMRHSLNLWNHVDEMRIDLTTAPILARNGIQAGVASAGAWPAIEAVLKSCPARTLTAGQSVRAGWPLILHVASLDQPETIFVHEPQGELVGRTLSAGRGILYIDAAPLPPRHDRVRLVMEPGALPPEETTAWALTPDPASGYLPTARFSQLVLTVTLDPGEILVIGPAASTTNEFLIGSRYFTRRTGGAPADTVLFISAQVTRHVLRK